MLKYVALLTVERPARWREWNSSISEKHYKSPIETEKSKVQMWLENELKKYPDASINSTNTSNEYFIHTAIIAFEDKESSNVEGFIKNLIPF